MENSIEKEMVSFGSYENKEIMRGREESIRLYWN